MGHIDWTEALSVGIDAIDAQHRRLLDIINRLDDAVEAGGGEGVLPGIMAELEDYTREHFSIEEEAFDETAYPEAKGHKAEHAAFIGKLADFRKTLAAPRAGAAAARDGGSGPGGPAAVPGAEARPEAAMLAFLRSWLVRHISFSDKRYRPWLAGRF